VSGEHILEAKSEVELTCVRLATRRRTPESVERLKVAIERERLTPRERAREIGDDNVHIVLAQMTGNPALHLFIEALNHLAATCVAPGRAAAEAHLTYDAHARIAEAVAAGDEERAVAEMAAHLGVVEKAIGRRRPDRRAAR
jgi:DNA-binding FadR family transcriptional regulator